ncbi:helix-turn-helix transcriptional regulator [Microbacterium sp. A93]|uniref:helix-turn-helix transcriptional regulator n=1 Tax=Microbacterium sp. A93 TaxID=3450716 RepID=UPI003F425C11
MTTIDAAALERVLSSVDVRLGVARRDTLGPGSVASLPAGSVWLVFVAGGAVHGQPPLGQACALDVDRVSRSVAYSPNAAQDLLVEGDAFLTLGRQPVTLRSDDGASLMIAELQLSDTAAELRDVLPEFITVTDFAGLEPAAAALARNLGPATPDDWPLRSGDPVICRLMTTTVLLSVIRAWAENGCAPAGWPSRSGDPFLDRVVEAIHDQPGREWTVEALAGISAMSRSVFAERFHRAIGRSPASYVTEVRMQSAKELLTSGHAVSDVSRQLGYASDEGFSRAFRRATGATPSSWRVRKLDPVPA